MSRRDLLTYLRDFGWRDVELSERGPSVEHAGERPGSDGTRVSASPPPGEPVSEPVASDDLEVMAAALQDCRRCRLCEGRRQVVFGTGNPRARLMFIGEAPGAEEDRLGEPFVGRAGQLLNSMVRAMGMERRDVYIGNIVKCRPPGNRDPEEDEAGSCLPFLWRQVELVDPVVIVTLGRVAARFLLGTKAPISSYRGSWATWRDRDVMPTFHPAYLLRNPAAKAQAWIDLKRIMSRLGE